MQIPADILPQHQLLELKKIMKGELGTPDDIAKASLIYETIGKEAIYPRVLCNEEEDRAIH